MIKTAKERDKLTLSFASEDLKKPMNELLNAWESRGYKLSTKGVTALIEMNHLSNSDHFSLVSSTYHYIYRNLKKVYGDNQEALYEAVDEVLSKVVQIDTSQLMSEIQTKAEQGRQLTMQETSEVSPLPKTLTTPIKEEPVLVQQPVKELGEPVLNTQHMIQAKQEMDQIEAQRAQQREEEIRLQQEREMFAQQQQVFEEMKKQMEAQMQQFSQMQQMAQMQTQMTQMQPQMTPPTVAPAVEETSEIDKVQAAQGFKSLMGARPY